jgi:NAD(P)-dependent dehydrogenase (short-subunit alcohol dehydrogenase family)
MGRAAALTFTREGASVVGCDVRIEQAEETVKMVHAAGGTMVSLQPCHTSICLRVTTICCNLSRKYVSELPGSQQAPLQGCSIR